MAVSEPPAPVHVSEYTVVTVGVRTSFPLTERSPAKPPDAVQFVALVNARTGDFYWVFASLAAFGLLAFLVASLLPTDRPAVVMIPVVEG